MANIIVDALTHLLQSHPNLTRNTTIPKDILVNHIKLNNCEISELSIQQNLRDCVSSGEVMAYGGNFRLTDKKVTVLLERLSVDQSEKKNTAKLSETKDANTPNLPCLSEDVPFKADHKAIPNLLKRRKKSEETRTEILERQKRQKRKRVPFDPSDDGSWTEKPKKRGRPPKKCSIEAPIPDDRLPSQHDGPPKKSSPEAPTQLAILEVRSLSKNQEVTPDPSVNPEVRNQCSSKINTSLHFQCNPSLFELKVSDDESIPSPSCLDLGPPIFGFSLVKEEQKNDNDVPNVTELDSPNPVKWTSDDVYDHFVKAGFKREADIFKEEEVDGITLLVMRRSDLVKGLGLKIGPAVDIFHHILRMQSKFNDE